MTSPALAARRLWRVRKHHVCIDAQLQEVVDGSGIDLRFFYDGALMLVRRCPTEERAVADAQERLRDLQRAGWNPHW